MSGARYLLIAADDYGIGPATSQGILDLASEGLVTATVLLVTSPYAEEAVQAWRRAGQPVELGWHPCLTLDQPVLPAHAVPSLVDARGHFWPLGSFLRRLALGSIHTAELEAELLGQYTRFRELVGRPPILVNAHHHVHIFPLVGAILRELFAKSGILPYVRRLREPWRTIARIPGARGKRAFLSILGRPEGRRFDQAGFPGNDWLVGVTDPSTAADPASLARWLKSVPGRVVELTCHPGYLDETLVGRDGTWTDGLLHWRVHELERLRETAFQAACEDAQFRRLAPSALPTYGFPGQ